MSKFKAKSIKSNADTLRLVKRDLWGYVLLNKSTKYKRIFFKLYNKKRRIIPRLVKYLNARKYMAITGNKMINKKFFGVHLKRIANRDRRYARFHRLFKLNKKLKKPTHPIGRKISRAANLRYLNRLRIYNEYIERKNREKAAKLREKFMKLKKYKNQLKVGVEYMMLHKHNFVKDLTQRKDNTLKELKPHFKELERKYPNKTPKELTRILFRNSPKHVRDLLNSYLTLMKRIKFKRKTILHYDLRVKLIGLRRKILRTKNKKKQARLLKRFRAKRRFIAREVATQKYHQYKASRQPRAYISPFNVDFKVLLANKYNQNFVPAPKVSRPFIKPTTRVGKSKFVPKTGKKPIISKKFIKGAPVNKSVTRSTIKPKPKYRGPRISAKNLKRRAKMRAGSTSRPSQPYKKRYFQRKDEPPQRDKLAIKKMFLQQKAQIQNSSFEAASVENSKTRFVYKSVLSHLTLRKYIKRKRTKPLARALNQRQVLKRYLRFSKVDRLKKFYNFLRSRRITKKKFNFFFSLEATLLRVLLRSNLFKNDLELENLIKKGKILVNKKVIRDHFYIVRPHDMITFKPRLKRKLKDDFLNFHLSKLATPPSNLAVSYSIPAVLAVSYPNLNELNYNFKLSQKLFAKFRNQYKLDY